LKFFHAVFHKEFLFALGDEKKQTGHQKRNRQYFPLVQKEISDRA
jgi:hypothetical protein